MASFQKQFLHNEPLLFLVLGCGRCESKYNMLAHLQVDDTHKEFRLTPDQKAKREILEEEKAIVQMGLTAWQKRLAIQRSAKEKKRVQEKCHNLNCKVALQRDILAKAEKKVARRAAEKAAEKAAVGRERSRPRGRSSYGGKGQARQRLLATQQVRGLRHRQREWRQRQW